MYQVLQKFKPSPLCLHQLLFRQSKLRTLNHAGPHIQVGVSRQPKTQVKKTSMIMNGTAAMSLGQESYSFGFLNVLEQIEKYICMYIYADMYVCIYTNMYVHTYIYIYI